MEKKYSDSTKRASTRHAFSSQHRETLHRKPTGNYFYYGMWDHFKQNEIFLNGFNFQTSNIVYLPLCSYNTSFAGGWKWQLTRSRSRFSLSAGQMWGKPSAALLYFWRIVAINVKSAVTPSIPKRFTTKCHDCSMTTKVLHVTCQFESVK